MINLFHFYNLIFFKNFHCEIFFSFFIFCKSYSSKRTFINNYLYLMYLIINNHFE